MVMLMHHSVVVITFKINLEICFGGLWGYNIFGKGSRIDRVVKGMNYYCSVPFCMHGFQSTTLPPKLVFQLYNNLNTPINFIMI